MALRTGLVVLTIILEHACRLLATYRVRMDQALVDAETAGTISSAQHTTATTFLDAINGACAIFKLVSGY